LTKININITNGKTDCETSRRKICFEIGVMQIYSDLFCGDLGFVGSGDFELRGKPVML
jgi:hypothetical protein